MLRNPIISDVNLATCVFNTFLFFSAPSEYTLNIYYLCIYRKVNSSMMHAQKISRECHCLMLVCRFVPFIFPVCPFFFFSFVVISTCNRLTCMIALISTYYCHSYSHYCIAYCIAAEYWMIDDFWSAQQSPTTHKNNKTKKTTHKTNDKMCLEMEVNWMTIYGTKLFLRNIYIFVSRKFNSMGYQFTRSHATRNSQIFMILICCRARQAR